MDAQEVMHMTDYSKITALYSRLSVTRTGTAARVCWKKSGREMWL